MYHVNQTDDRHGDLPDVHKCIAICWTRRADQRFKDSLHCGLVPVGAFVCACGAVVGSDHAQAAYAQATAHKRTSCQLATYRVIAADS